MTNASTESAAQGAPWLLLIHAIPPKPDYFRVKVRRRLQKIGALPLKNSVYVLPQGDESLEDFQWLAREIVADGGEAMVCEALFIEGISDEEIRGMFADAETDGPGRSERVRDGQKPSGAIWVTREGVK